MTEKNGSVISFDLIYQFSKEDIEKRIEEVRTTVMQQMRANMDNYVWKNIKSLEELESTRMSAVRKFLSDYENFLLMYTSLGYNFHIASMTEMLRVCKEIRIFPIVDLDANKTDLIKNVIDYFQRDYNVEIVKTEYEFQKGDNKLLIIRNRDVI